MDEATPAVTFHAVMTSGNILNGMRIRAIEGTIAGRPCLTLSDFLCRHLEEGETSQIFGRAKANSRQPQ